MPKIAKNTLPPAKKSNFNSFLCIFFLEIKCLVNTDYKFVGVVEAPNVNTKNNIVRKYPNIDLNIPGGKLAIDVEDRTEDPKLMCIKEALRELAEETGMTISSKYGKNVVYNYFKSENQIKMRKKYKLDKLPLQVYRRNNASKGDLIMIWLL